MNGTTGAKNQATAALRMVRAFLIFAVGLAAGAGTLYAHFSGRLDSVYHRLGWHGLMQGAADTMQDHTGHEEMDMPGMPGMKMSMPQGKAEPSKVPGHAIVTISAERQQLIGVRKGKVERGKLQMAIRAVGIIEPDQTRLLRIQTRVSGWVTKVYVNFVGQNVQKGEPLLEIYSPDLLVTQQEYLIAVARLQQPGLNQSDRQNVENTLQKLKLAGVADEEIQELEKTKKVRETLLLRAPIQGQVLERNLLEGSYVQPATELYRIADLSVVWLQAKLYEYELPHVQLNQAATVTLLSELGVEHKGKVAFIEPSVQEMTRTVKVRVEIDNPNLALKPGMYADIQIRHDMGDGLLIPESAVLRTGERALTFRTLPEGRFEPVEVSLGGRFGEQVEVTSGLKEGDEIVTSAGFLIDSESRLKSATGGGGGHKHGG